MAPQVGEERDIRPLLSQNRALRCLPREIHAVTAERISLGQTTDSAQALHELAHAPDSANRYALTLKACNLTISINAINAAIVIN